MNNFLKQNIKILIKFILILIKSSNEVNIRYLQFFRIFVYERLVNRWSIIENIYFKI